MSGRQYNKMNPNKETKLEVEQNGNQLHDFAIDARALMQARHDPTAVFLQRLYSAWEFRLYYLVSTLLAIAGISYCLATEGYAVEVTVALLLYVLTACEITGKIRLTSPGEYFKKIMNILETGILLVGLVIFLYRTLVEDGLMVRLIPFLVIIGKNVWEYYQLLKEEQERKQTKARASEELAFENLEEPVQIEMETIAKQQN